LSISYEKWIYLDIQKRCPTFKIAMNVAAPDGTPPRRFERLQKNTETFLPRCASERP